MTEGTDTQDTMNKTINIFGKEFAYSTIAIFIIIAIVIGVIIWKRDSIMSMFSSSTNQ